MPKYQYEAMNAQGQEVKDEVEALSSEEAISKIRNLGYFPTKIKEKGGRRPTKAAAPGARSRKAKGSRRKVKLKKLTTFTRQLSTLQDAGLPILRSLRILEQQQKPGTLRSVLGAVADDVEAGATLSEAMAKFPRTFDSLYSSMVAAGEAGGVLDLILNRLAEFMEKAARLKSKVIGAMVYPAAVLTIAFGIVMGIMTFVVPKFKKIFADFGADMPAPTRLLLAAGTWISEQYGWAVMIGIPVGLVLLVRLVRLSKTGRHIVDVAVMQIPVLGDILSKTSVSRFTRTLGTLISAGVPILDALSITTDTTGNEVHRRGLEAVHASIRRGESFSAPLRKQRITDVMVTNMIDVGEETGDLDKMLVRVADTYDEEVDRLVSSLVSLLEPVLVVGLGVICGFIVVSLFLPLVTLMQSLQK